MKLEVIKKQGARTDLTSAHDGQKLKHKSSRELIAQNCPDSSTQIQRYIRLNELIPEMLDAVDNRKFAVTPAVEISYLSAEEQSLVLITMESEQVGPSLSQAQRLRRHSKEGTLTDDMVLKILSEQNKPESRNLSLPISKISRYFPSSYTPQKMEETIYQLLDHWLAVKMKKQAGKGGR